MSASEPWPGPWSGAKLSEDPEGFVRANTEPQRPPLVPEIELHLASEIVDYADHIDKMTQAKARQLLDDSISVEKERLKVKRKYIRRFRGILPDTKVVRLMQIENRIDAMVELKIAEGIPLME